MSFGNQNGNQNSLGQIQQQQVAAPPVAPAAPQYPVLPGLDAPAPAPQPAPPPAPPLTPEQQFRQQVLGAPPPGQQPQQSPYAQFFPGNTPQQQPAAPPPSLGPAPQPPQIDTALLNAQVVAERQNALKAQYGAAYQQAQTPEQQQAIQLAYNADLSRLQTSVLEAQVKQERYEMQRQAYEQQATQEPLYRLMAAQALSQRFGVPAERLLTTPWGEEVWDPRRMLDLALMQSQQAVMQNRQAQQQGAFQPAPTGSYGQVQVDFSTMPKEQFEHYLAQARQKGIRLVG